VTILCNHAVFYRQKSFRILRRHAEKCSHNHPEQRSGASGTDRRSNSYNVARPDGRTQCCAQRGETRDFSLSVLLILKHPFQRKGQTSYLQQMKPAGEQHTARNDQDHQRHAPHKVIYRS
jgi:hypothetical protein